MLFVDFFLENCLISCLDVLGGFQIPLILSYFIVKLVLKRLIYVAGLALFLMTLNYRHMRLVKL